MDIYVRISSTLEGGGTTTQKHPYDTEYAGLKLLSKVEKVTK
jgi:hypothetical protein